MGRKKIYEGRLVVTTISLPDKVVDKIEDIAKERGCTKSSFIMACVLRGLDKPEDVAIIMDAMDTKKISNTISDYTQEITKAIIEVFKEPNKDGTVYQRVVNSFRINHSVDYSIFITAIIEKVKNKLASYNIGIDLEANEKLIKSILETELRKIKLE